MKYRITGLDPAPFVPYFQMSDRDLAAAGARRRIADAPIGYPCRVSLVDAQVGEELVLLPFEHHAVDSPYRAAGPIYVRKAAARRFDEIGAVPELLARRLLSVRAYDGGGMMVEADVCPGTEVEATIERLFADATTAYLHVHNAKPGCYVCRVDRCA